MLTSRHYTEQPPDFPKLSKTTSDEMAQTRGATGNARPRVFDPISTEPARKRNTTGASTKARTAKPKAAGGVTKKRAPGAQSKAKPTLKDKAEGAVEKAAGTVERKPGKKAAGTKKMNGTGAKTSRASKVTAA